MKMLHVSSGFSGRSIMFHRKHFTGSKTAPSKYIDPLTSAGPVILSVTVSSSKPTVEVHEHTGETLQHCDFSHS